MQPVLGEMIGVPGHRSSHCAVRGDTSLVVLEEGQEVEGSPLSSSLITNILHAASICSAAMLSGLSQEMQKCQKSKLKKKDCPGLAFATWLGVRGQPSALPGCRSHSGSHFILLLPGEDVPLLCLELLRGRYVSFSERGASNLQHPHTA